MTKKATEEVKTEKRHVQSKLVMSLSGGLDSTVLLYQMMKDHAIEASEVVVISFYYGSKHNPFENQAAINICTELGIRNKHQVDLTQILGKSRSALTAYDKAVPEGHYEAENMRETVVPGRNTLFASVLMAIAQEVGAPMVAMGIHSGDHHIYPDCRPEWAGYMDKVYDVATEGKVKFITPYIHIDKADIVRIGHVLKVPFLKTRTCYKRQNDACGKCGSCQERLTAFARNGLDDPLVYESRELVSK